jgi:hypothetical protein
LAPVPPPSPLVTTVLLAVAALAATQLGAVQRLAYASRGSAVAAPLSWYLLGVVLGPAVGLLDRRLLQAAMPALVLAGGWVAARAGAAAAHRPEPSREGRGAGVADTVASWLVPAFALFAVMRWLPPSIAPAWLPRFPVIAVLAAGIAIAASADRRLALLLVICVLLVSLVVPLPPGKVWRLPRHAAWAAGVIGGTILAIALWSWVLHRVAISLRGIVVGLALSAGIGLASGASPFVICATSAAELARRSERGRDVRASLVRSETPVAAILWVAAGTQLGGRPLTVIVAALALSLWPLLRRLASPATPLIEGTVGLALVFGYVWTAMPADPRPLVTAAALALLVATLARPGRVTSPGPLTSGLARVEVSV